MNIKNILYYIFYNKESISISNLRQFPTSSVDRLPDHLSHQPNDNQTFCPSYVSIFPHVKLFFFVK